MQKQKISINEFVDGLNPERVFRNFYNLSQVPRVPGAQQQISNFILNFAKALGLPCEQDKALNVIVRKAASPGYENVPSVMLTAHMDMVCEKNPGIEHDFYTEPLYLVREGDKIKADGTSLGADDGIGCAYIMSLLEDNTLKHPAVEAVFTTDEETDMGGALGLDYNKIHSKLVLNLDGRPLCGAAAGELEIHVTFEKRTEPLMSNAVIYEIKVGGLQGGHTGVDSLTERGNAIMLMNRVLTAIEKSVPFQLLEIQGGTAMPSAFARDSSCIIALNSNDVKKVTDIVVASEEFFKKELSNRDDHIFVEFSLVNASIHNAFSSQTKLNLMNFLTVIPDGLYTRDHVNNGHLQASSNTGVLKTTDDEIFIACLIRSNLTSMKYYLFDKIQLLCTLFNFSLHIEHDLPQWDYNINNELLTIINDTYPGESIGICDGTLECGIFSANLPGSTVISLALPHFYPHSPNEHFYATDAKACYEKFLKVLESLKNYK